MKFEDIYTHLFLARCEIHFKKDEATLPGQPQPLWRKILVGAAAFAGLCVLIWFPLLLFSNTSSFDRPVKEVRCVHTACTSCCGSHPSICGQVSVALGIRGFPNLYEIDRYESLSPLSAESTSSSSLCNYFGNPSLVCMHRDLGIDMKTSVAKETSLSSVCLLVWNQRGFGAVG